MESADYAPPHVDASRPSIGFPLGTALLLIIIFSLSGIFSCCYHWDKLQSFRRSNAGVDLEADGADDDDTAKAKQAHLNLKQNQNQSLPVLIPGDEVPKFIAMRVHVSHRDWKRLWWRRFPRSRRGLLCRCIDFSHRNRT